MDILATAAKLLSEKLGINIDPSQITVALSSLMGDANGKLNIADLVAKMSASGGMSDVVSSWLGDGANKGISASTITDMFGKDKLGDFASKLGIDTGTAANGLAETLPNLIDKASGGGSLLDSLGDLGGSGGLMDMAKKLF